MNRENKPIVVAKTKAVSPSFHDLISLRTSWGELWAAARDYYIENVLRPHIENSKTAKGRIPYIKSSKIKSSVAKALNMKSVDPLVQSIAWDLKTRTYLFIYRLNFWKKDVVLEQYFTRMSKAVPLSGASTWIEKSRKYKYETHAVWQDVEIIGKGTSYLKRRIREGFEPFNSTSLPAMLVYNSNKSIFELHMILHSNRTSASYKPKTILSIDLNMTKVSMLVPDLGPVFFVHSLSNLPTSSTKYDYQLKKMLSLVANIAKEKKAIVIFENLREADFPGEPVKISRAVKLPFVMLKKKLQSERIPHDAVDPRGTSVLCPVHNTLLKRASEKLFACPVGGEVWHRDVAAVYNIAMRGVEKYHWLVDCPDCEEPFSKPVVLLEDDWLHKSWREVLNEIERRFSNLKAVKNVFNVQGHQPQINVKIY